MEDVIGIFYQISQVEDRHLHNEIISND